MILELVDIRIHTGQNAAFEEAVGRGLRDVIAHAKGFCGFKVHRCVESTERYVLHIYWDTVEDHTVGFRQSEAFLRWRGIVGPFFASPPVVEHFELVSESAMSYVFAPAALPSVAVLGVSERFPVHRIYCIARNYEDHALEMGYAARESPFFFMKPADALVAVSANSTATLPYPSLTTNLHHEIELVVAIGVGGTNIKAQDALGHIYGYAVGLDMTRRDLQIAMKNKGGPWCVGKGFDHAAPVGPITPAALVPDLNAAEIRLQVNGQERQRSPLAHMIWNIAETIEQVSTAWSLQPGDLIFTGTPAGVGPVVRGDTITGSITGLQSISVRVE